MRELTVAHTHDDENTRMFATENLQPQSILDAQKAIWIELNVQGASQKTAPENFLILGNPFEQNGKLYSRILNEQIRGRSRGYKPPATGRLGPSDLSAQVVQNPAPGVPLAWEHVGDGETEVLAWHTNMGAEAKNGRVLFNLHYNEGWTALFHEPVHESAPDGGIGTAPRWIYEGYCELFAEKIASRLGYQYSYVQGPYGEYARETQKLIAFAGETYFARAYFLNDDWSYGLIAPIFYEPVAKHAIAPAIDMRYLPAPIFRNEVPSHIKSKIQQATGRGPKPEWYTRWVRLYGRSEAMPSIPASPTLGPSVPLGGSAPPAPPLVRAGSGSVPPAPPMIGGGFGPPPAPLVRAGSGSVPPAPPLVRAGSGSVPPAPPLVRAGSGSVPPAPPLAGGAFGPPPAPPLVRQGSGVPSAPPLGGLGPAPPAPGLPGIAGSAPASFTGKNPPTDWQGAV